jgi:chromosome segregation protein
MKIKRLEIKGFKSFPDKTVLEIRPGITAVVGPNGCGKSNVMEAIRWVMGEQRAKSLRGKRMEDVIFNGSESRKPVGMAEVRLVLTAADGFAHPSMADYDEIMITRRLFRDGASQYEINNIGCRLSDITDFFLDTGVGKNSYAIIEQGRVDMVVASKPEDRRVLIDEAAGISRYKSRREAALKKLEQTTQNLQRINDVIGEVKRQYAALKRQAAKAERYRSLSDRMKEMDIGLHAFRCHSAQLQLAELNRDLKKNRSLLVEHESQFSSIEAQLEKDRLKALETERNLKKLLEERHRTDIALTSVRGRIEKDQTRIVQLRERLKHSQEEKVATETELRRVSQKRDEVEKSKTSIVSDLKIAQDELKQALSEMREADQALKQYRKRLDTLKDEVFRALQQSAQERNHRDSLKRRGTEIEATLVKIAHDAERISTALAGQISEKNHLARELAEGEKLSTQTANKKAELVESRKLTQQRLGELRREVAGQENQLAADKARLESLEEMQRSYQGYDQGVRFLMKNREARTGKDLLGPLAEMVEVPPEYEKALAAALGDRLGHVVVSSPRDALSAVNQLKEAGAGRSTFIPVCPRCEPESQNGDILEGAISLQKLVSFRKGFEILGDFLLRRCFVAKDMNEAVEIWEKNGVHVDLVTLEGEVLNRHGEVTGGSQEKAGDRIFEKRRKLTTLKEGIAALEQAGTGLQASLKQQEALSEQLSSEIDGTVRTINDLNMKQVRLKKDLERVNGQVAASERRSHVLTMETEQLIREKDSLATDIQRVEEAVSALETKRTDLEKEREAGTQKVEDLSAQVQDKSKNTGEIRVRAAQMEERNRSLEREYQSISDTVRHLEGKIAQLEEEAEQSAEDEINLSNDVDDALLNEKELMQEHSDQSHRIDRLNTLSAELTESVTRLETESGAKGKAVQELRETVHGLEMESVRIEQILDGLVEKILDRYRVDPRTVPCPESPPDEHEVANIRQKLETMGEVNLAAIAERTQTEERLNFLQEQEADLKHAVESLYETVNAINRTTRERFREAFDSVNEKFQEIFPFLFRGGEARLELTDEQDLLETGVDIMARPPGKRKQNMDLLSGGEKALTAVALIFSIFLIRPSPFCLLDEVDAPLDDANLARFNEMIRDLCTRTQFLIITHNKRSMEEADSLYGVTMEEPGSSTVVSVKFMD